MSNYDFVCQYAVPLITGTKFLTVVGVMINNVFYFTPTDLCVRYQRFVSPHVTIKDIREYTQVLPVVNKLNDIIKFITQHKSFENETMESLKVQLDDIDFDPKIHTVWERFLKSQ